MTKASYHNRRWLQATLRTAVALVALTLSSWAGPNDPIRGEQFEQLVRAQRPALQTVLREILPVSDGYCVTGPLMLLSSGNSEINALYSAVRVICSDLKTLRSAAVLLQNNEKLSIDEITPTIDSPKETNLTGFRGVLARVRWQESQQSVRLTTTNQERFLIWAARQELPFTENMRGYALAISEYLFAIDNGELTKPEPVAGDYGLPTGADLYAAPPDYVIEGYDNYLAFLEKHASLKTDFAAGILAFIPSDSLLDVLKTLSPDEAFPNKEWPMLQTEYRKFFSRGGDVQTMNSLTRAGFDTLEAGEYFFAVSMNGDVRFGRELLRAEVQRLEQETGRKLPRANHAFLFPGEPILTAGAFFIVEDHDGHHLSEVNAQSGHYFYSNVSATIREDIAERSNHYLLTLGHFFKALDQLDIPYQRILISKF